MRRNSKANAPSPDSLKNNPTLAQLNLDLLIKLVGWLAAQDKIQRRYRNAVLIRLSKIEAIASLLLVGQMAKQQNNKPFFREDKLREDAAAADQHVAQQTDKMGVAMVKYIYDESSAPVEPSATRHDRRRKWSGWEI